MEVKPILIPNDRLSVNEHIQLFADIFNYPLEICVDQERVLVYQNEVYNLLLKNMPFSIDANLMATLVQHREDERLPEPHGSAVVVDNYNCYLKHGEHWYPYRFHFVSEPMSPYFTSKGKFSPELDHPLKWNTLLRFLKTFYPHRRKFNLYRSYLPFENYYVYLRSLYLEFKSIPSNELETMDESRRTRTRIGDELVRRRVLGHRV